MSLDPREIRKQILTMAWKGQSVHIPSAFSIVEILSVLYTSYIKHLSGEMFSDHFVLSKGHGTMSLYVILKELGLIPQYDLDNYFKDGSKLHGLPESTTPGIATSSGSLGHGLPVAVGMALGLKLEGSDKKVFCLAGDGEMNEGPMWESMLLAAQHNLSNLILIIDVNKYQAMGKTSDILNLENLTAKMQSFGFHTERCDGHSLIQLKTAFDRLLSTNEKPKCLVADTIKGKGVPFMESNNTWHYTRLDEQTYQKSLKELV